MAAALGISRPTVESHVRALEVTHAVTLVRPFHGGGRRELMRQPRIHGFDTGFVAFARGWDSLRHDDLGPLWGYIVLGHLQEHMHEATTRYWRDKSGHEIDFVLARSRDEVDTIECKWDPGSFDATALDVFRGYSPRGRDYLVTPSGEPGRTQRFGSREVRVCTPSGVAQAALSFSAEAALASREVKDS
jgi:hypothetical protein